MSISLVGAGQWKDGDPGILIVADAGYDATRLAFLLQDLPVELLGRLRSDRVMEHTFRLFKQVLGWTKPKIRDPQAADRWTWIIIAVHTQLRLARPLANDLRRSWESPCNRIGSPPPGSAEGSATSARSAPP